MINRKNITLDKLHSIDLFSTIAISISAGGNVECIMADSSKKSTANDIVDICVPMHPQHSICIKEIHCEGEFHVAKIEGNLSMVNCAHKALGILIGNMKKHEMNSSYFPGFTLGQASTVHVVTEDDLISHKNVDMIRLYKNITLFSLVGNKKSFRSIPIRKASMTTDWVRESISVLNLQKDAVGLGRILGKESAILPISLSDGEVLEYSFQNKTLRSSKIDIPQQLFVGKNQSAKYLGSFALSANAARLNEGLHVFMDNARIFFAHEHIQPVIA